MDCINLFSCPSLFSSPSSCRFLLQSSLLLLFRLELLILVHRSKLLAALDPAWHSSPFPSSKSNSKHVLIGVNDIHNPMVLELLINVRRHFTILTTSLLALMTQDCSSRDSSSSSHDGFRRPRPRPCDLASFCDHRNTCPATMMIDYVSLRLTPEDRRQRIWSSSQVHEKQQLLYTLRA